MVISAKVDPANAAFRVVLFFKALKVSAIKIAGKMASKPNVLGSGIALQKKYPAVTPSGQLSIMHIPHNQ